MKARGRSRTKPLWVSLLAIVFILCTMSKIYAQGEDETFQVTFYVH